MPIELDEKRREIVDADGHILVLGGPGAGKTTVALLKVTKLYPGLLPGQAILFMSFSRAAMRQVLTGCRNVLRREEREAIRVKTYHAFCLEVLETHGRLLTGKRVSVLYPTAERLKKAKFKGAWNAERERMAAEEGVYCFDLLAAGTAELLERSTAIRELLANCYPMVIVDEFQDTDDDQWRIVKALSKVTRVFCLADADQRIFEYRDNIDPERINALRALLSPKTFDLGGENHRSPRGGILGFGNAVLKNHAPLPVTEDVTVLEYPPRGLESYVHAAVVWTFSELRKMGIADPCVAVLARSNALVAQISSILNEPHKLGASALRPVEHGVVWDAELSAAAGAVVASIMEWSANGGAIALARTLELIAYFYDLKNAASPSAAAEGNSEKYRAAATRVRSDEKPRLNVEKELRTAFAQGLDLRGDPVVDWRVARQLLLAISSLNEIFREARMVRLFRASDAIGSSLANLWLTHGDYSGAARIVTDTLEQERFAAADQDPRGCLLMSIHKSKGKEFDAVVLVEGAFVGQFFPDRDAPLFEQSRRLLRVGITRAKTRVTIVRPKNAHPLVG